MDPKWEIVKMMRQSPRSEVNKDKHRKQLKELNLVLQDIVAQARAYETVLRGNNQAVAAIDTLKRAVQQVSNEVSEMLADDEQRKSPLTRREHEVLILVAQGLLNKQVAYELGISDRTVQFHLKSIFDKLVVSSRTEAVVQGLERGWLKLTD